MNIFSEQNNVFKSVKPIAHILTTTLQATRPHIGYRTKTVYFQAPDRNIKFKENVGVKDHAATEHLLN
jgi:hypothetical protein